MYGHKTIQIQMCLIVFQEHPWPCCYGRLAVCSGRKRWQLKPKLHREVQSAQQQVGRSLLHVHAPQQCGRSRTGTPELPATLLAHPLSLLHQPLTRGHRLAELSLCCYSPDWLWEKTQLLCLRWRGQVNEWRPVDRQVDDWDLDLIQWRLRWWELNNKHKSKAFPQRLLMSGTTSIYNLYW